MPTKRFLLAAATAALLAGCNDANGQLGDDALAPAGASTAGGDGNLSPTMAALADSNDGSLMTLSGTVAAAGPAWFQLGVGGEEVTVEMDDWDWYQEGKALKVGDRVTVTGRVDKGLWEQNKLEASSVYVHNLGVSFLASGADEEELTGALTQSTAMTSAQGLVTAVEGQEFTVGAMTGPVRVDASKVKTKPAVKLGDVVYSWGALDLDPAEGVELMADGVVLLTQDKTKKAASAPAASGAGAQPDSDATKNASG